MKPYITYFTILLLCISCEQNDNDSISSPGPSSNIIEGKIILPQNSTINPEELSVQSTISNSPVVNNLFSVEIPKNQNNFLFVTDKNEQLILIGYNYPDQLNFDISSESTIIALSMNLPFTVMLNSTGKFDLITKLKAHKDFPNLVKSMDQVILSGNSPLDTSQNNFLTDFFKIIDEVLAQNIRSANKSFEKDPVNIIVAGKTINFINGGKLYSSEIGIYKNEDPIKSLSLGRISFFASSVEQAIHTASNNIINGDIIIVDKSFTFDNDGDYEIKIRTGLSNDSSNEDGTARLNNLINWTLDFVFNVIPMKGDLECRQTMVASIKGLMETAINNGGINWSNANLNDILFVSCNVGHSLIDLLGSTIACYSSDKDLLYYTKFAKKLLDWTSWVSRTGTAGNIVFGIGQWIYDNPSMDLCYTKNGNSISKCSTVALTTNSITSISSTAAISGGNITNDGGSPIIERGVCWSTLQNPTIANNKSNDGAGNGSFVSNVTGLTENTTYYVRAFAINSAGTSYGNEVPFTTSSSCSNPNPCNCQTAIAWGGHVYELVEIGSQCWFAENLRYTGSIMQVSDQDEWISIFTYWTSEIPAWCYYDNNPANDAIYGKLYNFYAVKKGELCPPGWHIPRDSEWTKLTNYLGGAGEAGGKMKAITGWDTPNTNASNSSGFSGLPGGSRQYSGIFDNVGSHGGWWSSSEYNDTHYAISRYLSYNSGDVINHSLQNSDFEATGLSCRCLRD